MIAALVYLQACSWRNRLAAQLRRLRKPQYLIGALFGLAYFGFFFLRPAWSAGSRAATGAATPEWLPLAETGAALGGLLLMFGAWFLGSKRATLDFTEAEIAFLFPAPVPRHTLIHYRLLKTQLGLAFSALIMALVTGRLLAPGGGWRLAVGWWVVMSALELHRLAAGFARTRLLDRGVKNWMRRLGVVAVAFVLGWGAFQRVTADLAALPESASLQPAGMLNLLAGAVESGLLSWLLLPLRWLVRPLFAPDTASFALSLLPALGVMVVLYLTVRFAAVAFEEETVARAEKLTKLRAAVSSGNWHLAGASGRERRVPFRLSAHGPRLVALLWTNLLAVRASLSVRMMVPLLVSAVVMAFVMGSFSTGLTVSKLAAVFAAGITPMLVLVGPELARFDLRQDLPMADLIKTYPLRGWQLVLGELLAPALFLAFIQWLCVGVAAGFFPARGLVQDWGPRVGLGLAAAMVFPLLTFAMLVLHNAAALWFPAWMKLGPEGAQGFESMGQRLLLMLGQLVFLVASLLLPGGVGALVFLAVKLGAAWYVAVPAAAAAGALVLAFELALAVKFLGDRFERMDVTD